MYVGNNWLTEPEVNAYIKGIEKERDKYKAELIKTLRQACTCVMGDRKNCCECQYYYSSGIDCPTQLNSYAAKLRLEQLLGVNNIC